VNGERQGSGCLQNVAIVLRGYLASAAVLGVRHRPRRAGLDGWLALDGVIRGRRESRPPYFPERARPRMRIEPFARAQHISAKRLGVARTDRGVIPGLSRLAPSRPANQRRYRLTGQASRYATRRPPLIHHSRAASVRAYVLPIIKRDAVGRPAAANRGSCPSSRTSWTVRFEGVNQADPTDPDSIPYEDVTGYAICVNAR
jgi:hypothetical protein